MTAFFKKKLSNCAENVEIRLQFVDNFYDHCYAIVSFDLNFLPGCGKVGVIHKLSTNAANRFRICRGFESSFRSNNSKKRLSKQTKSDIL